VGCIPDELEVAEQDVLQELDAGTPGHLPRLGERSGKLDRRPVVLPRRDHLLEKHVRIGERRAHATGHSCALTVGGLVDHVGCEDGAPEIEPPPKVAPGRTRKRLRLPVDPKLSVKGKWNGRELRVRVALALRRQELELRVSSGRVLAIVNAGDEEIAPRARHREGAPNAEVTVAHGEEALERMLARGVEAFRFDPPSDRLLVLPKEGVEAVGVDLREVGHDDVGAGTREARPNLGPVETHDEPEPAPPPGLNTGERILDHDRSLRSRPERFGRGDEHVRRGLAGQTTLVEVDTVEPGVEQALDAGGLDDLAAVAARRDEPDPDSSRTKTLDQRDRGRKGLDALLSQPAGEQLVFSARQAVHGHRFGRIVALALRDR
jgi:hypothetical protein